MASSRYGDGRISARYGGGGARARFGDGSVTAVHFSKDGGTTGLIANIAGTSQNATAFMGGSVATPGEVLGQSQDAEISFPGAVINSASLGGQAQPATALFRAEVTDPSNIIEAILGGVAQSSTGSFQGALIAPSILSGQGQPASASLASAIISPSALIGVSDSAIASFSGAVINPAILGGQAQPATGLFSAEIFDPALALPTTGLVGLWESDSVQTTGSQVDQANDKVGSNPIIRTAGSPQLVNGAVVCDGDDTLLTFPAGLTSATQTLIVVAKFTGAEADSVGFGRNFNKGPISLGRTAGNKLALYNSPPTTRLESSTTISASTFICGSLTYNGTQYEIFVNGVSGGIFVDSNNASDQKLTIGSAIRGSAPVAVEWKAMAVYQNTTQHATAVAYFMDKYGL